jgi:hypothetical protein
VKYLIILLINLIALAYVDYRYNQELINHYVETRHVLEKYCVPSAVLQSLTN